jgi:hypothetical protein
MKKLFSVVACTMALVVLLPSFSFAGWVTGYTVDQVKQTAALCYARLTKDGSGTMLLSLAPTIEKNLLAVLLTAQASGKLVDVNVSDTKMIGVAINN